MSANDVIAPEKIKAVKEIKELCSKYGVIGLVKMMKIGAKQITDLRAKLRGKAKIKMAKKTIMKRAFEDLEKEKAGLSELLENYDSTVGPSALVLTNMKALKLRKILEESKSKTRAKAGDVVDKEIIISAGNTNIPPGPVISELSSAGLPTRIQDGTIWIQKDTPVLQPGDMVDGKLAMVLGRLNIEPIEVLLDLYAAYQEGEVIGKEILTLDINQYKDMVAGAYANAMKLSVELGIITPENAELVLLRAYMKAKTLALKLPIVVPQLLKDYLMKAKSEALALDAAIRGEPLSVAAPAGTTEPEPEAPKEEEPEEEEEEEVGLGGLFG